MFYIYETGGETRMSDTLVPVCVTRSGNYAPAKREPDGFTVMLPATYTDDETGDVVDALETRVYVLPGHTLKGTEPEATYEEQRAVPIITELESDLEEAYTLLYGGDA